MKRIFILLLAFVLALCGGLLLAPWCKLPLYLLLAAYLFCDLLFAVKSAMSQEQGRILALLTLPFLFPAVHIIYGIGTIAGLLSGKG